jgi:hypothetical protein
MVVWLHLLKMKKMKKLAFIISFAIIVTSSFANELYKQNSDIEPVNAIKTDLMMPVFDSFSLFYERSSKSGFSNEFELGLILLNLNIIDVDHKGAYLTYGPKFIFQSKKYKHKENRSNIHGFYLKPEIGLGMYNRGFKERVAYAEDIHGKKYYITENATELVKTFSSMLIIGNQWSIKNKLLVDLFFGFGYGSASNDADAVHHHFIGGYDELPIAFRLGIKIGYSL